MKYLKVTMALFAVTLCASLLGASATHYIEFYNITIPSFGGSWISQQVDKGDDWQYNQRVKKVSAHDSLNTGDGRNLRAKIQGMFAGMGTTAWQDLVDGINVTFDDTKTQGGWKLHVKSRKSLPTTAKADFNWDLGSISSSPYPYVGQ